MWLLLLCVKNSGKQSGTCAKFLEEHNRITGQINEDPENAQTKVNEELNNATGKALSEKIMKEAFGRIIFQTDYSIRMR